MKQLFSFLALATILFSSCKKKEKNYGGAVQYGTVRFTNSHADVYKGYLDGTYFIEIEGYAFKDIKTVNIGMHNVKAVQSTGVTSRPLEFSGSVLVSANANVVWEF